jgi:hypothetical protein
LVRNALELTLFSRDVKLMGDGYQVSDQNEQ